MLEEQKRSADSCSETDTDEGDHRLHSMTDASSSERMSELPSNRSKPQVLADEFDEDVPLVSLFQCGKSSTKQKATCVSSTKLSPNSEASPLNLRNPTQSPQNVVGRKRVRVVLSDDEDDVLDDARAPQGQHYMSSAEGVASSDESEFKCIHLSYRCLNIPKDT